MSISKLPYITLDGKEYQIVVIDDDIVLQGLHDVRELTKGWLKLLDECYESYKFQRKSSGPVGYVLRSDEEIVSDMADEWLYDYVLRNYKDAVIVQHNLN